MPKKTPPAIGKSGDMEGQTVHASQNNAIVMLLTGQTTVEEKLVV